MHDMGNEMGNQNVSGLQEPMEPDTPAKVSEAALSPSDLESLQVKKVSVPTSDSDKARGNRNQSSSDLANVSEVDGSHIQDQASRERDNSATAMNAGNHVENLLPPSRLDGGEEEKISVETEDLHMNSKNADTTNSRQSCNHLLQNEASTGTGEEHKISMESEGKKNCDQKSSIDSCSDPSSSVPFVSTGDVIQSSGSSHFGENNDEMDGVGQMDRKSISVLRDVKSDGDGDEIQAEMDVSRTNTTELPSSDSLESFYLEAIDCDIQGVFLGDDTGAAGMGAELNMNVHGRGFVLVSQEEGKVSDLFDLQAIESEIKAVCLGDDLHAIGMGDEMNTISEENREVLFDKLDIDKNDMLQTDSAAIEAEKEKKPLDNDDNEIYNAGIENSLQADDGEQTESGQQIKLHDGGGLISEKDVEGQDNEREDTGNSFILSLPLAESIGVSEVEEREDADPKGEESEDLWSDGVKNELEQDLSLKFNDGSMNEEILRPASPQPHSLNQETDLVLPILVPLEKQQETATENSGTESKTLEPRQTLEPETSLNVYYDEGFGNRSGSPLAETSEPTSELGQDESQFADGSLNENGAISTAISQSPSQEEELSCSLTKFLGDNEQKTHSEIPANGEMLSTKLSRANFDRSEMHTSDSDLENSPLEIEVPALKTQTENIEECLSHFKDEWATHGVSGLCEKDEENQHIQLDASDSPSIKVSDPQMTNEGETRSEEPLSDEENRKNQGILGGESHLSETTPFDYSPSAGKSSISALKASPAMPDHEASASESWEEVQENHIIQIGVNESPESDFALPPANAEASVVEKKIEEFEQKIMLQQASTAQDEASQAQENNEKSVTASRHQEESATKHLHSTGSSIFSKIQTAETELQILKPNKSVSFEAAPVQKQVFVLERSNSEKLKTPLPNSVKEETHQGEPLQNQVSLSEKKTLKEDWESPKKEMTTSAKGRGKPKSRYSLFSHCMCCTAVIQ